MNNILIKPLMDFFDLIVKGIHAVGISNLSLTYFLAILIFTVILRMILLPLTINQTKTTVKSQELQPKIKELQEKYKNDPKTLQEKQMELYKESGANPIAGCLPLLIQLPIFMAMYAVIYNYKGFEVIGFLWIKSLGKPDLPLAVISGLTTYLSMLMVQPKGDDPTVKTQKQMGIFMSLFSVYIGFKFKSGLVLYWVLSNIIQMGQQYFVIGRIRKQEEEKLKEKGKLVK